MRFNFKKNFLWYFLAVFLVVGLFFGGEIPIQATALGDSNLIFCSDWISMGCAEVSDETKFNLNTYNGSLSDSWTCNFEKGCDLTGVVPGSDVSGCVELIFKRNNAEFFRSSTTCLGAPSSCIVNASYSQIGNELNGINLNNGESISIQCVPNITGCYDFWGNDLCLTSVNINFLGNFNRLAWCSQGPTAVACDARFGVPVQGADGCAFNLDNITNKPSGLVDLILPNGEDEISGKSYVVPVGQSVWFPYNGTQHICGTLSSTCSIDSDCWGQYPFDYGNGYGNADIVGGNLVEYRCVSSGPSVCKVWSGVKEGQGDCLETVQVQRCSAVQTGVVAECNPLTPSTCGTNAFCDPDTFKCKATGTVVCTSENDPTCLEVVCDRSSGTLREGYCANPGTTQSFCDYRVLRDVQCCTKADCAVGQYCTVDYTCKESVPDKSECPWDCCQDDPAYFDKPLQLPAGQECCPDHTLASIGQCEAFFCTSDADCKSDEVCNLDTGECEDGEVCEDREPTSFLSSGWMTVSKDTPIYLINFPMGGGLIPIGSATSISCVEVVNWPLVLLILAVLFSVVLVAFFFRPRGKSIITSRRRKK